MTQTNAVVEEDEMTAFVPKYSKEQVDNCSFDAWYEDFKHVAIKSVIIPLPPAFIRLLLADQIILPAKCNTSSHGNDEMQESEEQEDTLSINKTRELIEQAIARFKGRVFVKTNWSCPQDAMWMLGSLQCTSFDDVFMLLKSSDFIVHDLTEPYSGISGQEETNEEANLNCQHPILVLKKYCNFYDSMHFRCFVRNHQLIGVCQRKVHEFFDFLQSQQDFLCELILDFYQQHFLVPTPLDSHQALIGKFPDRDFIFDVYVDQQHKVHLVDINVFGDLTDPLLFTWQELVALGSDSGAGDTIPLVDFRIVESPQKIQANPLSSYRTPTDFVDHLVTATGMEEFLEQVRRDNNEASSHDSDSDSATEEEEDSEDTDWCD